MKYASYAVSDIGNRRQVNQDSLLVRQARNRWGQQILMAIICDGMGGLSCGELASAETIRYFESWFSKKVWNEATSRELQQYMGEWALNLRVLNSRILAYSRKHEMQMGTTFTGILMIGGFYMVTHVGDSRLYLIDRRLLQLTEDHVGKKKNALTRCIGAFEKIEPQQFVGRSKRGTYLLCSDGFRHHLKKEEFLKFSRPVIGGGETDTKDLLDRYVRLVQERGEHDNISAIVIESIYGIFPGSSNPENEDILMVHTEETVYENKGSDLRHRQELSDETWQSISD